MRNKYFSLVLHTHIPYVISHGTWPHGTDWLCEACAETYIPLLNVLNRLVGEGISPRITINLSPVLCEQLASEKFSDEFISYLENKIKLANNDIVYFSNTKEKEFLTLANYWRNFYENIKSDFNEKYNKNIIKAFKKLQDDNHIEIITCAATHGYLPLLSEDESIEYQIRIAKTNYKKYFGRSPIGIWLPECAYRPSYDWNYPILNFSNPKKRAGIEEILSKNFLKYFIIDSHLLKGGEPIGIYLDRFKALKELWKVSSSNYKKEFNSKDITPYQPYIATKNPDQAPVYFFARDPKTSLVVWSGEWGYPGDGNYLEFHKKSFPSGLRYWKITGRKLDLAKKEIYNIEKIKARLEENSDHFIKLVEETLDDIKDVENPIITSPFDTELFGHWWMEGPEWIYLVIKKMSKSQVRLTTLGEYLDKHKPINVVSLPEGSWGEGGFHWIWLNDKTSWTWEHVYNVERYFKNILAKTDASDKNKRRIVIQMLREMLLLQSSDWQFLISTMSARDYAEGRVFEHYDTFMKLKTLITKLNQNEELTSADLFYLKNIEERDFLFPELYETI
jgi:1,4-alpha-glucan branching enzyme